MCNKYSPTFRCIFRRPVAKISQELRSGGLRAQSLKTFQGCCIAFIVPFLALEFKYFRGTFRRCANGVVCKWGRTDLTGFYFFGPVRARLVPLRTHDFKGFRTDFNRIPWNLDKNCLTPSSADPIYPVPKFRGLMEIALRTPKI